MTQMTFEQISNTIIITRDCPFCGKTQRVSVSKEAFDKWNQGALIQNALPTLTDAEREILISGMCDDCFPTD